MRGTNVEKREQTHLPGKIFNHIHSYGRSESQSFQTNVMK